MKSITKYNLFLLILFIFFSLSAFAEKAAQTTIGQVSPILRCYNERQVILLHVVQGFGLGMLLVSILMLFSKANKIWICILIIISLICYIAPLYFADQTTLLLITPDFIKHLFVKNVTLFD